MVGAAPRAAAVALSGRKVAVEEEVAELLWFARLIAMQKKTPLKASGFVSYRWFFC